jgi:hypothetical protein
MLEVKTYTTSKNLQQSQKSRFKAQSNFIKVKRNFLLKQFSLFSIWVSWVLTKAKYQKKTLGNYEQSGQNSSQMGSRSIPIFHRIFVLWRGN